MKKTTTSRLFSLVLLAVSSLAATAQQPVADPVTRKVDTAALKAVRTNDTLASRAAVAAQTDTLALQGVTVTSAPPFITQTAGKLVINVAAGATTAGGNAYEVLLKAPGMIEQQDVLQFRGRPIQVLINNRPSNLTGEELKAMLLSTQASTIEKVEVLSNPSSAYDAKGGVVVNLKMAKNKNLGTNGSLTSSAGMGKYGRYAGGFSLNHRSAKMNVYGGYDWAASRQYNRLGSERSLDRLTGLSENEYAVAGRTSHTYRAGLDYDINKNNSAGFLLRGLNTIRKRNADNVSSISKNGIATDSGSSVNTRSRIGVINPSVNVFFRSLFDGKGRELVINADYFWFDKKWDDDFTTSYRNNDGVAVPPDYLLQNNSTGDIRVRALSADYTQPFMKGIVKAGVKSTYTSTDNNADWQSYNEQQWQADPGKTNHFLFNETINAAYASYSRVIRKVAFEGGLRLEQTITKGESKTYSQVNRRNYTDLFPSVAINYNASAVNQFGFSYRRSITRFGFEVVNPFVSYISQYRYSQGNPSLRPSYQNSLEASHTFRSRLMSTLNYSHFNDVLTVVFKKDPNSEAVISTQDNLSSASQVAASVTSMETLRKNKWSMNNTVGVLYAQLNDPTAANAGSKSFGGYLSSMHMLTFKNGWNAELSGMYMSRLTIGILHVKAQGSANLGVSKVILRKNGKLTLNVTDIFNTQLQRFGVESYGVDSYNKVKAESRAVRLAFSWKFGNKNVKAGRARQTSIEEVKKRTEG